MFYKFVYMCGNTYTKNDSLFDFFICWLKSLFENNF